MKDGTADPIDELKTAVAGYSDAATTAIKELTERLDEMELKANRPPAGDDRTPANDVALDRKAIEGLGEFGRTGEFKSMSAGADPDGGYSMQPQLAAAIRQRAAQVSPIRAIANVITLVNADTYEEPAFTDLPEADWAAETASRPTTTSPKMAKTTIPTHDLYCNPPVSQRLLDNSHYDVGQALIQRIGKKFGQKEGAAFVTGNGVGKPTGILAYAADATADDDDARAWGKLQYVVSGSASTIADADGQADGLIDLVSKLAPEFLANARWIMNRKTAAKVRKMKDSNKDYIWQSSTQLGQPNMLLGYPVVLADDMPNEGAGNFPIAFGDFREGYAVVDALSMTILRDPFTNKPFVNFFTTQRVGGDVLDFDAIKLLKCAAS